jgi:Flp pilus assembly protein TadD
MDILLPQAYLIGLIVLLGAAALVIGFQLVRVRRDETTLSRLESEGKKGAQQDPAVLYELASVQLRKRLYAQAVDSLQLALKRSSGEPLEAQALIQNALGFSLAAQSNHAAAIRHYKAALQAKADYPVALNNLGYAYERLSKPEEARQAYEQALALEPGNKTTQKRLKLLDRRNPKDPGEIPGRGKGMKPQTSNKGS